MCLLVERALLDGGGKARKTHSFKQKLIVLKGFIYFWDLSIFYNNDRTEEACCRDGSRSRRCEEAPDRAGGCSAVPTTLCYGKNELNQMKNTRCCSKMCICCLCCGSGVLIHPTDSNLLNQFNKGIRSVNLSAGYSVTAVVFIFFCY